MKAAAGGRSAAELRRFGVTVGGAFTVFATISWWRGHEAAPLVLATLAGLLVVPGLVAPRLLGPVERGWMRFALALGHINTRIILTALFYLLITPISLVMRCFRDPLDRSLTDGRSSHWVKRPHEPVDLARYQQQF